MPGQTGKIQLTNSMFHAVNNTPLLHIGCILGIKLGKGGAELGQIQDFREGGSRYMYGTSKVITWGGHGIPCWGPEVQGSKVSGILRPSQHVEMFYFFRVRVFNQTAQPP